VEDVARVVLALESADVIEEVMHFLDRSGSARVVATAIDDRQLAAAVRQLDPDAVVAQPGLAARASLPGRWLALETRETIASLRQAIQAGANGFFVWPAERDQLVRAVADSRAVNDRSDHRALVVGVHGARGGAGVTFISTHLAAAFARLDKSTVLLDIDVVFGDVATALGAPAEAEHTLGDLVALGQELSWRHLEDALWEHPSGFRVLLPPHPQEAVEIAADHVSSVVTATAAGVEVVVLHLPRSLDGACMAAIKQVDRLVEVLTLDVLSFRATSRAIQALAPLELGDDIDFVVNRTSRSEITPGDVSRVFGKEALAVVPSDRGVGRAQDHGLLLSHRGRVARAFNRLAVQLVDREESSGPRHLDSASVA
jgi:Flp pilus assembly CpaE family ATPase